MRISTIVHNGGRYVRYLSAYDRKTIAIYP